MAFFITLLGRCQACYTPDGEADLTVPRRSVQGESITVDEARTAPLVVLGSRRAHFVWCQAPDAEAKCALPQSDARPGGRKQLASVADGDGVVDGGMST